MSEYTQIVSNQRTRRRNYAEPVRLGDNLIATPSTSTPTIIPDGPQTTQAIRSSQGVARAKKISKMPYFTAVSLLTILSISSSFYTHPCSCDSRRVDRGEPQNKAGLLAALNDNIERQHMMLAPVKSLVGAHKRPSKFDSTSKSLYDESQSSSIRKQSSVVDDDGMKKILLMHEQMSNMHQHQRKPIKADPAPSAESGRRARLSNGGTIVNQILSVALPIGKTSNSSVAKRISSQFSGRSNGQRASLSRLIKLPTTANLLSSFLPEPDLSQPIIKSTTPMDSSSNDLMSDSSNANQQSSKQTSNSWLMNSASQLAQGYLVDSVRGLLTLSQLPILPTHQISTAPSIYEKEGRFRLLSGNATSLQNQTDKVVDALVRYLYILGTGVRRKRDPLKALEPSTLASPALMAGINRQRLNSFMNKQASGDKNDLSTSGSMESGRRMSLFKRPLANLRNKNKADPRGVIWDMASDPSLAVTVFHLIERASVALPLGFLLMPFVHLMRNPLNGLRLDNILPPRAAHRSVDYEELAKRLDLVDRMLSRALRQTHRESSFLDG